ncbi:asparagine synthetase B [Ancylomarina salipaludis]|uniref:Asparagine synthetase B n=1 Tax=Ancylomarina salipaludis TaxID=2501299 RepID=A0A4Q1JHT7_9BACT|nr:asparagine synthetase B [Ancylomarina salipaludis]RXQ87500.1 asparagine synthetase B [Ancylomarina salipaludis]
MSFVKRVVCFFFLLITIPAFSANLLIPMDETQKNHLKSYGIAFWVLQQNQDIHWLLNYRGGSFLLPFSPEIKSECQIRGVSFEVLSDAQSTLIFDEIANPEVNMDAVKLQKPPKMAVYSPQGKKPWDDAVTLALTYAEIPYDLVYDDEVMQGKLSQYDWLHLHHEDFTGQFGKFYAGYRNLKWYKDEVRDNQERANHYGYAKVSDLKLAVSLKIKAFVEAGGFLFAMCSATDTFDIALSSEHTDICSHQFDGDPMDENAQEKLEFKNTFAFENFTLEKNPMVYEFSDIDVTQTRKVNQDEDYFTLFDFSAKWDPIPSMLCQNHNNLIKGFMGQTTAFNTQFIKPNVLIMGENKTAGEARYIHGTFGKGTWTFYGGHDPEDYQHLVGDPPTDLNLKKNSSGYRLILNNVLFPAAKKKKRKT